MSRTIRVSRYQHPVDIPPLQWTPTGYRRITPRGVQPPKIVCQEIRMPRPSVWLSKPAWVTLNLIAFVLIAVSTGLLGAALINH